MLFWRNSSYAIFHKPNLKWKSPSQALPLDRNPDFTCTPRKIHSEQNKTRSSLSAHSLLVFDIRPTRYFQQFPRGLCAGHSFEVRTPNSTFTVKAG
ncbi:hypothetical protein MN608_09046 [Microdochium nivale]|nr:hypothetical protein MN608_09046 [Microdochium nivale]